MADIVKNENMTWKPVNWINGPRKGKLLVDEQTFRYEKKKVLMSGLETWRCVESRNHCAFNEHSKTPIVFI